MNTIRLISPTIEYKQQLIDYREQFVNEEDGIHGSSGLAFAESIEQWLVEMDNARDFATVREDWVPAEQYIAVNEENEIVGMLNFRKSLNEYLLQSAGNIGYSVAPSERRKGYATKMLQLALQEAPKFGLTRVLITCTDDNVGSIGVIENNGGVLEDIRIDPHDNELTRRYWITV